MNHTMKLEEVPYRKIEAGTKIIESRLFDEKRQTINLGDTIEFQLNSDTIEKIMTKVIALLRYPSFDPLMNDFPSQQFGGENKMSLIDEIHQFYGIDEEQRYGVLGIKIELL